MEVVEAAAVVVVVVPAAVAPVRLGSSSGCRINFPRRERTINVRVFSGRSTKLVQKYKIECGRNICSHEHPRLFIFTPVRDSYGGFRQQMSVFVLMG